MTARKLFAPLVTVRKRGLRSAFAAALGSSAAIAIEAVAAHITATPAKVMLWFFVRNIRFSLWSPENGGSGDGFARRRAGVTVGKKDFSSGEGPPSPAVTVVACARCP